MSKKISFRRLSLIEFANSSASSLPGMERFIGLNEQKEYRFQTQKEWEERKDLNRQPTPKLDKSLPPTPKTPSISPGSTTNLKTHTLKDSTRSDSVTDAFGNRTALHCRPTEQPLYFPVRSISAPGSPTTLRTPNSERDESQRNSEPPTPRLSKYQILTPYSDPLGLIAAGVRLPPPLGRTVSVSSSIYSGSDSNGQQVSDSMDEENQLQDTDEHKLSEQAYQQLSEELRALVLPSPGTFQNSPSGNGNMNSKNRDGADGRDVKLVPLPLFWANKMAPAASKSDQANHQRLSGSLRASPGKRPVIFPGHQRKSSVTSPHFYREGNMSLESPRSQISSTQSFRIAHSMSPHSLQTQASLSQSSTPSSPQPRKHITRSNVSPKMPGTPITSGPLTLDTPTASAINLDISSPISRRLHYQDSYAQYDIIPSYIENQALFGAICERVEPLVIHQAPKSSYSSECATKRSIRSNPERRFRKNRAGSLIFQASLDQKPFSETNVPFFQCKTSYGMAEEEKHENIVDFAKAKLSKVFKSLRDGGEEKKMDKRVEMLKRSITHVGAVDAATAEYDVVPPGGWI